MSETPKVAVMLTGINPKFWVQASRAAEAAGFESVWVPEHLVLPVQMSGSPHTGHAEPPIPPSMPAFDAFLMLGMIASATSTIRLGTNVYNIGLRHPFVTARAVCTLDALGGGRVELGIGASWLREEWEATQLDFGSRGRRVDETIDVCRRLWTDEVVEHHGEFFDFQPVMFNPKPIQQPVPMNHSLEELPAGIKEVDAMRADAGRDGRTTITVGGGPKTLDDLRRYRDAGVDRVIAMPYQSSRTALDDIERYGDEVLAKLA
jgi:alkanesulfonate monooxygenase SsuD/methylene tetrahydromethanopterin reductase-like flavin-dependent oxidoreductase (luciferase family)